jgi:hypothetical protein
MVVGDLLLALQAPVACGINGEKVVTREIGTATTPVKKVLLYVPLAPSFVMAVGGSFAMDVLLLVEFQYHQLEVPLRPTVANSRFMVQIR